MIVVHRQHDLLDVVGALSPAGRLTGTLGGRQQEPDQEPLVVGEVRLGTASRWRIWIPWALTVKDVEAGKSRGRN